jgi:hypothetical protein
MQNNRKFIIELLVDNSILKIYIKKIYKNHLGYYFSYTKTQKNAKIWKFKKNCENAINRIQNNLDPTKHYMKKYKLQLLEITDNQILRKIKLKKLKKNKNISE